MKLIISENIINNFRKIIEFIISRDNTFSNEYPSEKELILLREDLHSTKREELIYAIKRHNLTAIFCKNLLINKIYPEFDKDLKKLLIEDKLKTLQLISFTLEITSLFNKEKIKYLILKGIPLSIKTTNNSLDRGHSLDLDIFIDKKDLQKISNLLYLNGFKLEEENYEFIENKKISKYFRFIMPEILFSKSKNQTKQFIDLHWRSSWINSHLINFDYAFKSKSIIKINNKKIYTLNNELSFIHACNHATADNWMNIRNLIDIDRLARKINKLNFSKMKNIKTISNSAKIAHYYTKSKYLEKYFYKKNTLQNWVNYSINYQVLPKRYKLIKGSLFINILNKLKFRVSQGSLSRDTFAFIMLIILPPKHLIKIKEKNLFNILKFISKRLFKCLKIIF